MLVRLSFSVLCSKSSFVLSNRLRGSGKWCVPFQWLVNLHLNGEMIIAHVIISNAKRNVSGT